MRKCNSDLENMTLQHAVKKYWDMPIEQEDLSLMILKLVMEIDDLKSSVDDIQNSLDQLRGYDP